MPNIVVLLVGMSIVVSTVTGGVLGWMVAVHQTARLMKANGLMLSRDGTIIPSPERIEALMEAIRGAVTEEEEIRGRDNYQFN